MSFIHHPGARANGRHVQLLALIAPVAALIIGCGAPASESAAPVTVTAGDHSSHNGPPGQPSVAMLANAAFQDIEVAEAAGYASSMDTLGCFQNPDAGGMGVHYINDALLDATVNVRQPEALVYELGADGRIAGLVAHEYIVPVEAWTSPQPPSLFGMQFHRHPSLPLWVLHAWLWKPNPDGMFADWNPAVRLCPAGVPVFGRDLPVE